MDQNNKKSNKFFIPIGIIFLVLALLGLTFNDWRHFVWKKPVNDDVTMVEVDVTKAEHEDNEKKNNPEGSAKVEIGEVVDSQAFGNEHPRVKNDELTKEEDELIAIHDLMRPVPSSAGLRVTAPTGIEAAQEGLIEVKRMIEPGSTEEILGILLSQDIYPGRIISITSLARPDYNLAFSSLGGFSLHPYNVYAAAITPQGTPAQDTNKNPIRFESREIEAGMQDSTRRTYEFFLQDLQSKSANAVGNGHVELIVKTAKSVEEACQKLGIHLAYKGFSADFDKEEAKRTNKEYLFMMLKHEYFQVQSSVVRKSPTLLTSRVEATRQNIEDFSKMAAWKLLPNGIPYQEVPAVIDVVTYGRIVLVASERAIFDEQAAADFEARFKNPTSEVKTNFQEELYRFLEGSTYKVITWGGGAEVPPNPLGTVQKERVTAMFLDSLSDTVSWSPTTPGRPIGFQAKYLNQGSTVALSHNFSDKDVIGRQQGYPVHLMVEFHCGDDMDGWFLRGMGEWKITLKSSEDSKEQTLTEMIRISDGHEKPQWNHPTAIPSIKFNKALTLTISAHEDDEDPSEKQTFDLVFDGTDFSQVPKAYDDFSRAELKALTQALTEATNKMFELRRFGDIHLLAEADAKKRAGDAGEASDFMKGYLKAKEAAKETEEAIQNCRIILEKAKGKWTDVQKAVEAHEIVRQSTTQQDNFFVIKLKPNPTLTTNAVNSLFDSVDETLKSMTKKLTSATE